jgi:hypothetical protein
MEKHSAAATAAMILINAQRYAIEREREVSRFRLSTTSLKRIAGREVLREAFRTEVADELFERGWLMVPCSDTELAVIRTDRTGTWPKFSSRRVNDLKQEGDDAVLAEYSELFPEQAEVEEATDD